MLQLRPTCEQCNKPLPPESTEAMICSFECTFCQSCVATILDNVCPNCGGGFCARPNRPKTAWVGNVSLATCPASTKLVYKPVDAEQHRQFAATLKDIAPAER
jgi:hypothetical protein